MVRVRPGGGKGPGVRDRSAQVGTIRGPGPLPLFSAHGRYRIHSSRPLRGEVTRQHGQDREQGHPSGNRNGIGGGHVEQEGAQQAPTQDAEHTPGHETDQEGRPFPICTGTPIESLLA